MSFVKKTFLYPLLFFTLSWQIGYAQDTIVPTLLLQNQEGYQFYSFEKNTLSLYTITQESEYFKIWEYQLLNNKKAEMVSMLFGDIKGGIEKEIIMVLHSFGTQGEIYIFSIEDNQPQGPPEILKIPTTKKGTRPTQAELINWDQKKKQEILLSCSSPERELLVLDYYNNNLSIITTVASEFMTSTYGPIKLFITDQNQDGVDDILIYSTKDKIEEYIHLSGEENKTQKLKENINFSSIKHFKQNPKKHTLALLNNSPDIYSIGSAKKRQAPNKNIISIVAHPNNELIVLSDKNKLTVLSDEKTASENNFIDLDIQHPKTNYIVDQKNRAALFTSPQGEALILVVFQPTLRQQTLTPKPNIKKILINTPKQTNPNNTITPTTTEQHDTLYVNEGSQIKIPILQTDSLNIESVETHKKPDKMVLNPETLEFVWAPKKNNTGPQKFEYSVTYSSPPKLKQAATENAQLALKNTFNTTHINHQHVIFVNDLPQLKINNIKDTIHITESFESPYNIIDKHHRKQPWAKTSETRQNNILINNNTLYWEPETLDAGEQRFLIIADDGRAQDSVLVSIVVDTTIQKIEYDSDFTITVNESFVHQLPHTKETIYNIIQGPNNLRVSQKGTLHWVPIITQVDLNTIIIEAKTAQKKIEHILNIYVNAPPVISYQPAPRETIITDTKFKFKFQSFDMNTDANLQWTNITNSDTSQFIINQFGMLEFDGKNQIDNFTYVIHLNDKIDKDIFIGELYVNDPPNILSTPEKHIQFGETYNYILEVEDNNKEKPYDANQENQIYYHASVIPEGAALHNKTLSWTPTKEQIGKNLFKIEVTDSIDVAIQEFSVFVNDKPSIVSPDSLSIMLGDTLFHYFDAQDLNQDSELLYTIKTTIDNILFSGKAGKLVWVPKEEDLGFHTLEIGVSDGFNTGEDIQKLKIFVYKKPILTNIPKEEAFVNMEYQFKPKGHDMFQDSIPNRDVFFDVSSKDSLFSGRFNSQRNLFLWTPTIEEIGEQQLLVTVLDKYKHKYEQAYSINVILSPCETLTSPCEGQDTLIISQTDTIKTTIIDSIFIEKKDTVYIDKAPTTKNNNRNKWKPKGLGF